MGTILAVFLHFMDPIDYAGGFRGFAIEEGVNGFFSIIAGISDFFVNGGDIVLLHGFIKKTQKTPTEDKARALQRKNAYIKSSRTKE